MEIEIQKSELIKGLSLMQGVCGRRLVVPILAQMFFEAMGGKTFVTGSDMEVWIQEEIESVVKEEGRATVDAKKFYEIVKEFPDQPITIKSTDQFKLRIRCGKANFNLLGMPPDEFPTLPVYDLDKFLKIPTKLFRDMLDKTIFAASDEVYKQNIAGVYFVKPVENLIRMVATDGRRLCLVDRELSLSLEIDKGFLIPKKGAMELRKMVSGEEMNLGFNEDFGFFRFGKSLIAIRLIESKFIPYENDKIFPVTDKTILISKSKLMGPLRLVSTLTNDKNEGIVASFKENVLELSSSDNDFGEGSDEAEISYQGEPFTIGLNVRHLMELLESIDDDEVSLEMKGTKGAVLIKPIKEAQQVCIIMPMKV